MKSISYLFICSVSIILFGFSNANSFDNFTPPGTVKISIGFFMDETEITNLSWLEYLHWIAQVHGEESEEYMNAVPDTMVWEALPFREYYLTHSAYRNYPVVGVSWDQANAYCKWRSDRVMEQLLIKKGLHPKTIVPKKLSYRLPTVEEWNQAANVGYKVKIQNKIDKEYSSQPVGNFKNTTSSLEMEITSPVNEYWPNKLGIYNLWGNVSEMTTTNGLAKGGSWLDLQQEATLDKIYSYSNPNKGLGFRCVCEVQF